MASRGRIGGHMLRATHDPQIYTGPTRSAFLARLIPDDPDLVGRHVPAAFPRGVEGAQLSQLDHSGGASV